MFVACANELLLLFLGLELISIPTYVMLYLARQDSGAQESAAKYFFLSVFSSALFLYGLSMVYGASGTTNLVAITHFATHLQQPLPATLLIALGFLLAALGFKVAAVPFHFYAPDVYQGTTNTLAALLAWVPKAAGFIAMIRLITFALPSLAEPAARLAWVLAVLSMTIGNVLGLMQDNLRRLFAYSSIAHAGYMLIGIGVGAAGGERYLGTTGTSSVVFYLVAYGVMTLGAFASIVYLSSSNRSVETVSDLAGLGRSQPAVALALAVFMFSLTGIPATAGFWGKFAVFSSALASGDARYVWVAVIGVINAAISSYYYLRIIGMMYLNDSFTPLEVKGGRSALSVVACCAVATLLIGVVPGPLMTWASAAGTPSSLERTPAGPGSDNAFISEPSVRGEGSAP
jgi:NADH-quinone oxidoreductase subunit N